MLSTSHYIGRFAPSPSGPLHFGSLVCALASYLHARQANGKWLVRIEDIDTPRIDSSFNPVILDTLIAHGMHWDEPVSYQSEQHARYERALSYLKSKHAIYGCACSRRQIRARANYYDRHCRNLGLAFDEHAVRFKNDAGRSQFKDSHYGMCHVPENMAKEDPVLRRADGIYAYHLAVVADDIEQGVTHIVRGADLIDTTPIHLSLFEAFEAPAPIYLHIPVAVSAPGQKLSKQHHAPAVENDLALKNLKSALLFLGCEPKSFSEIGSVDSLIAWAIAEWRPDIMPQRTEILVSRVNGVYCVDTDQNTLLQGKA